MEPNEEIACRFDDIDHTEETADNQCQGLVELVRMGTREEITHVYQMKKKEVDPLRRN